MPYSELPEFDLGPSGVTPSNFRSPFNAYTTPQSEYGSVVHRRIIQHMSRMYSKLELDPPIPHQRKKEQVLTGILVNTKYELQQTDAREEKHSVLHP